MTVKAKFYVQSVKNFTNGKEVEMNAVYGSQGENADFAKATPNGSLKIFVDNSTAATEFFVPGEDYYLTFEKSEK